MHTYIGFNTNNDLRRARHLVYVVARVHRRDNGMPMPAHVFRETRGMSRRGMREEMERQSARKAGAA